MADTDESERVQGNRWGERKIYIVGCQTAKQDVRGDIFILPSAQTGSYTGLCTFYVCDSELEFAHFAASLWA